MKNEREYWLSIWAKGVYLARNGTERDSEDYGIVANKSHKELHDKSLISDRAWVNAINEALLSPVPSLAFELWKEEGWLYHAIPEIDKLWGRAQPELHHPEIDTGIHVMMVIDRAAVDGASINARWAALVHDFGKSVTPEDMLPAHHGHELAGVPLVKEKIKIWNIKPDLAKLLLNVTAYHGVVHNLEKLKPLTIIELIDKIGLKNNPQLVTDFCAAVNADDRGRKNFFHSEPRNVKLLSLLVTSLENLTEDSFVQKNEEEWQMKISHMRSMPNFSETWFSEDARRKFEKQKKSKNTYDMINDIKTSFKENTSLTSSLKTRSIHGKI